MDDKDFDDYVLKLFDRVFDKMDNLSSYMDRLNETLIINTTHLEYHIKRTDQAEASIKDSQERIQTLESRMVEEIAAIRASNQKREENDILRFETLKADLDQKLNEVLPLVKQVCDDVQKRKLKREIQCRLNKARRDKVVFWLKIIGGISTALGILAAIKVL